MSFFMCLKDKGKVWPFADTDCDNCNEEMKHKCYARMDRNNKRGVAVAEVKIGNVWIS